MPVRVNAQDATQRWVSGVSGATQKIAEGVDRVTQAPGAKAAAKAQKWLNEVNASAAKWQRNVARVSLTEWQDAMKNVGIPRVAQGAQAKQAKYEAGMAAFLPFLSNVVSRADQMDDTTLASRINKAVFVMTETAKYRGSGA